MVQPVMLTRTTGSLRFTWSGDDALRPLP